MVRPIYIRLVRSQLLSKNLNTRILRPFASLIIKTPVTTSSWTPKKCGLWLGVQPIRPLSDLPFHTVVELPSLSPTMETGSIQSWAKNEGDQIEEGDVLCQIETDKAVMAMETPKAGFLAKVIAQAGSKNIAIGAPIAIIVKKKDDINSFKDYQVSQPEAATVVSEVETTPVPEKKTDPPASRQERTFSADESRIKASPYAKMVAKERGIDLSTVTGSGPGGRIRSTDLSAESVLPQSPLVSVEAPYTDIEVTGIRQVIAKRLLLSKQTIPHFHLSVDIQMDRLMQARASINKHFDGKLKISVNDFIIKAASATLMDHPACNSHWLETHIRQYNSTDIAVAVSTKTGLLTPVVFRAETKSLSKISKEMSSLVDRARQGKLTPSEFQGGTFTISNMGMLGITCFDPIINPPQSCILALGCPQKKFLPCEDGSGTFQTVMTATLACDHRVVDGAVGAEWLTKFKSYMEDPYSVLY